MSNDPEQFNDLMRAIDAAIAEAPALTTAQLREAEELRDKAQALSAEGNDDKARLAANKALSFLRPSNDDAPPE